VESRLGQRPQRGLRVDYIPAVASIWRLALMAAILLANPGARLAHAQEQQSDETTSSVLTDAQFSISFRKYTPPTNDFSPPNPEAPPSLTP